MLSNIFYPTSGNQGGSFFSQESKEKEIKLGDEEEGGEAKTSEGNQLPPIDLEDAGVEEYDADESTAYLAYLLREAEITSRRLESISRQVRIMIALLALNIIVLIIYWLDITGAINFI